MLAHLAGTARCKSYSPYKEGAWRWSAGVQAAFANTLPMASFALAGHLSLGLIASPGDFTALYGTTMPLRVRLRALPFVTAGFVVAFVLGVCRQCVAVPGGHRGQRRQRTGNNG
jgi:hypothetical protein